MVSWSLCGVVATYHMIEGGYIVSWNLYDGGVWCHDAYMVLTCLWACPPLSSPDTKMPKPYSLPPLM